MVYDPFHSPKDPAKAPGIQIRLTSYRQPPIFDVPLTSLEWSTTQDTRKRMRSNAPPKNGHPNLNSNRPEPNNDANSPSNSSAQKPSHPEKETVREVIRYVENVVPTELANIMGVPPLVDDRVRYVVNFMLEYVNSPYVEIEAKLGSLIEHAQSERAVDLLPIMCETPLRPDSNKHTYFKSEVSMDIFSKLNTRLNKRVEVTSNQKEGSVQYLRTNELAIIWPNKIREIREKRPGPNGEDVYETVKIQNKTRLGDLNMLCPNRYADVRYSASSETDSEIPQNAQPVSQRLKDRISYKFEFLSVDITSVERLDYSTKQTTSTCEVEVEIDSSKDLFQEVCKYRNNDNSSRLFDIATSLVNTVRLLLED